MADPFSIASGVAGIVSLGITICSGLDTYFSAIKDRDDDLKRASELLSLLRRYIELIRPSASTLSSRHAQATDLVVLALGSCEGELRALKELVENLKKVDGASDVARKWDKSKSVITYPFQRKKLTQIQDQLLKATGALGTVIQALILHVGVSVGDDLEAFRTAVQDNHLVTAGFLTRIESKVERVEVSTQQTEERLTAISTGLEERKALASNSQTLVKDTSLVVSGKLDAIAEGLRLGRQSQTAGISQQKDIPRYLRNSMIEMKCIQDTATGICPCQGQKDKIRQQPLTTYRFWGGLAISYQSMSKGHHQPGCCFYKRCTKTTITYTGLRFLLSKVLSFSLQRDYQCGSSLTTHSLRTYNIRETSQAFGVFNDDGYKRFGIDLKTLVQEDIKGLQLAYSSGKASPFDVDKFGRNVAHLCVLSYKDWMGRVGATKSSDGPEGLKMILRFLQQVGVNVYAGTDSDSSMMQFVLRKHRYVTLGPVYDVLANSESQFDLEQDYESTLTNHSKRWFVDVLQERPDIMEGLGYKPLFLAVAKRDEAKLMELIESIRFAEYLRETDLFGQNIVHFCLNWETGLRLLLEEEATRRLVNQPDAAGNTPLMDALAFSEHACQKPGGPDLCSSCRCSTAIKLLLETDCPMGLDLIADPPGLGVFRKAKIALLEHLAQRRERLQQLALNYLSESELRDLGVSPNELPDITAPAIWDRLQSLHQSGVVKILHKGLDPLTETQLSGRVQQGIFHLLDDPRDAESIIPCPCTTEELSRPLHHIVASSLSYMGVPVRSHIRTISFAHQPALAMYLLAYLSIIASDVDVTYLAKSIIRVLTMEALSISHLPQCREWPIYSRERFQEVKEEEEWDAMLDEDPILIEKLNDLCQGFEQEFSNQNLSIEDFLQLHWHPRMRQVRRQIRREHKAVDEDYRKELREIGVVLVDESEPHVNSGSHDTSESDDDSGEDD
ncbi:uncharacterized protein NECHADRAFT_80786 [Fusarium vanettenii 77-13-4]|uniref:Fungal N-terminal domain-containing protein n=1 Tax=Fusarium vanettenii (strain ATCC MYA-4622 / CBS 123669 / FGSC 9596 / NRRL 45880 / 77-13-4) TaxID=660122 RepID=C7YSM4_FUSV7|nr:uncharacterized protein NECHADRAFT_80786 [Fusarium vanettenii 77-13-4]EEU45268.1 hypothetical protein NECHADRAFT_80786 [Fusarium vanettenii 77-13-4]